MRRLTCERLIILASDCIKRPSLIKESIEKYSETRWKSQNGRLEKKEKSTGKLGYNVLGYQRTLGYKDF